MGARGARSSAELSAIDPRGIAVVRCLSPPAHLTTEQAEVWRGIVNAQPADWFRPGSAPVLAALCRHTIAAQRVASRLARLEQTEDALEYECWFKLLSRHGAESKAVAALATRLRLTPQSRYTPHGGSSTGRKGTADGLKPRKTQGMSAAMVARRHHSPSAATDPRYATYKPLHLLPKLARRGAQEVPGGQVGTAQAARA